MQERRTRWLRRELFAETASSPRGRDGLIRSSDEGGSDGDAANLPRSIGDVSALTGSASTEAAVGA